VNSFLNKEIILIVLLEDSHWIRLGNLVVNAQDDCFSIVAQKFLILHRPSFGRCYMVVDHFRATGLAVFELSFIYVCAVG
jgi:hypothetical protein